MTSGITETRVLSRFGMSRLVGLVEERLEAEPAETRFNLDRVFEVRGIVDSATSGFTLTIADSRVWITAGADWSGGIV